jgi:uncharacterized membrane protein
MPPGQTTERVGFFTDAVFAIAMTLLVIEIPRPDAADLQVGPGVSKSEAVDRLWRFLVSQHSSFYAYFLAFFMLWIVWREHHLLLDQISHVSPSMIGWHFPLLLLAAFLPYATAVIGHYSRNPLAALLYGLVVGALLLCRSVIQSLSLRGDLLLPGADRRQAQTDATVSWIVVGYWILGVALVWWAPWEQIPWYLTSVVAFAAVRIMRRRAEPAQAGAERADAQ